MSAPIASTADGAPPPPAADELLEFEIEARALQKQASSMANIRDLHMCTAQSISYRKLNENGEGGSEGGALTITRGEGQYLFDVTGRRFLDTRNNVGHVGWQHPAVTGAITRQIQATNSNTRYLHPNSSLLAQKLSATMPDGLDVCFFVNSGSEANDLALRLANTHTNNAGHCIVVDRAYHGHTTSLIDISPYKFNTKGGRGCPEHVQVVRCPDMYRGVNETAETYAHDVEVAVEAIEAKGGKLKCFFVESGMSVGGVIIPPSGYLSRAFETVRKHGGVCVADEVQVGLGRFGDCFWGFQQQGVVPDIVTIGKPFGNGFPLAVVVCSRAIADSFTNGMEYFNTFGGNPVACAAGLAVLETIRRDGLQENALVVGKHLRTLLKELALRCISQVDAPPTALIGDVRGSGLFLGIELVSNIEAKTPATAQATQVMGRLLQKHQVLTSLDGRYDNVIVMKPPMCFSIQNADSFVKALEECLLGDGSCSSISISAVPTS